MRRVCFSIFLALLLLLGGCGNIMDDGAAQDPKNATASCYPVYALALNVVKDVPALTLSCLLQPQDACLRSYRLSDWDRALLSNADVALLAGRGLESFQDELLQAGSGPIVISALDGVTLSVFGEETANEDSSHLDGESPWAFLSVAGAMNMCSNLAHSLAAVDETYAEIYLANLSDYMARLEELVSAMNEALRYAPRRKIAVLHEGLAYFPRQFLMEVVCCVAREPGEEPGDNEIEDILATLSGAGAEVALLEERAPAHLVEALEEAGYSVALLDTLSAHEADGDLEGYEKIMRKNAQTLAAALKRAGGQK